MIPSMCCTEWGQDFRPEYLQLGLFKDSVAEWVNMGLPHVPIMAVTATATKVVQAEIISALKMSKSTKVSPSHQNVFSLRNSGVVVLCSCRQQP